MSGKPSRILIVTGLSGAGKTTALHTFEDMGWEVVDTLPVSLLDRLLVTPPGETAPAEPRPLAFGIGPGTRGFDAGHLLELRDGRPNVSILFLDCAEAELERRFSATRRRHPLALDRPAADGITQERRLTAPVRNAADQVIDTTGLSSQSLQDEIRGRFGDEASAGLTLTLTSFGYSAGLPRHADLVLDMRFLRNPHWVPALRPLTGFDPPVAAHVAEDPAYADAMERVEGLLLQLLPRYAAAGKPYVTVAFGCTGGRHRSVHVTEAMAERLRSQGFCPTIVHRDLPPRAGGNGAAPQGR